MQSAAGEAAEGAPEPIVDIKGHGPDCQVYLQYILMLIGAEHRGSSREQTEPPAADL